MHNIGKAVVGGVTGLIVPGVIQYLKESFIKSSSNEKLINTVIGLAEISLGTAVFMQAFKTIDDLWRGFDVVFGLIEIVEGSKTALSSLRLPAKLPNPKLPTT